MNYKEFFAQQEKQHKIKSIYPNFTKLEKKGDQICGALVNFVKIGVNESNKGFYRYTFDTDDGQKSCILGASLDEVLPMESNIGKVFRITYKGEVTLSNNRTMHVYDAEGFEDAS